MTLLKNTFSSILNAERANFDHIFDDLMGFDQEFLAGNQAGGPSTNTQANFFLLKSSPLIVSQAQMLEFLQTFFGQATVEGHGPGSKLTEQEVKYLYNHGYRQVCEKIKLKIRQLSRQADQHGAVGLRPEAPSPLLDKLASTKTNQAGVAEAADEEERRSGINSLFLPLGSDNGLVEVNPEDNGSIIAYALNSNLYKEALIKNNYLDF